MKNSTGLAVFLMVCSFVVSAQDEGAIVKRERIGKDKGIFIAIGPSATLGKNIGDYSVGFNIEGGFVKRLNRVFSIGPSLSYVKFKYDPEVTQVGFKNAFVGGPYQDSDGFTFYEGLVFQLEGGDISLLSLALNLKLNLIPVKDNSKISVYGFAKPFVSYSTRTEVTGKTFYRTNYGDFQDPADWYTEDEFAWIAGSPYVKSTYDIDVSQDLKEESKVTGGIFIGPGIEFAPAKKISGFFQVAIGYTFPITYVSTEAYNNAANQNNLDVFVQSGNIEKYPMQEKGFPSVSLQLGASYNF
ncbi:MAG: hypothetical protein C0490_22780 [Marivirga sp.]|nr:hypothetical protein [Marivirga sp.]